MRKCRPLECRGEILIFQSSEKSEDAGNGDIEDILVAEDGSVVKRPDLL